MVILRSLIEQLQIPIELIIKKISKRYGRKAWGLHEINFDIGSGVLGLVGPNRAGKSTLMRILATITKPTHGQVLWNGIDIQRAPNNLRQVLGYLPQDFCVYPQLSAIKFLEYLAAVKGLDGRQWRTLSGFRRIFRSSAGRRSAAKLRNCNPNFTHRLGHRPPTAASKLIDSAQAY